VKNEDGNSILRLRNTNSTFKRTQIQFEDYSGGIGDGFVGYKTNTNSTDSYLYLGTSYSGTGEDVVIRGGNVGVGTLSPNSTLQVVSSVINASKPNITSSPSKQVTSNGTFYCLAFETFPDITIGAGIVDQGYYLAVRASSLRNKSSDLGRLVNAYGVHSQFGHYSTVGSSAVTDNAYGIRIDAYHAAGTITNSYGVYISPPNQIGGTVANQWSLYSANPASSYFAGDVGIGTDNPCSKLQVKGTITANEAVVVNASCTSDRRFKTILAPITSALDKIKRLSGVLFTWKRAEFPDRNFPEGTQIGLIAQDVEKVLPELVHTADDGYKSLSYDKLTAVLVEAVKEQQKTIESLEQRIKVLEARQ
jgi:hypothetical protein